MRKLAAVAVCLVLSGPALAQSVSEKTGANSLLGISPSTADFVTQAAISDMFEIQSSQLALQQSDEPTKAFAKQMITDHEMTAGEIKAMVQSGKVQAQIPAALDTTHQNKIDTMKGLKGEAFTKQYHSDQVTGHKNTVDLYKRYAAEGENSELKSFASKHLPHLEQHLTKAQELNK
jgi:putative membrane protein